MKASIMFGSLFRKTIETDVDSIAKEFISNTKAALKKYRGHTILLHGWGGSRMSSEMDGITSYFAEIRTSYGFSGNSPCFSFEMSKQEFEKIYQAPSSVWYSLQGQLVDAYGEEEHCYEIKLVLGRFLGFENKEDESMEKNFSSLELLPSRLSSKSTKEISMEQLQDGFSNNPEGAHSYFSESTLVLTGRRADLTRMEIGEEPGMPTSSGSVLTAEMKTNYEISMILEEKLKTFKVNISVDKKNYEEATKLELGETFTVSGIYAGYRKNSWSEEVKLIQGNILI
ncbi:hypothetical protein [Leptospira idonii]|uniref:Uncharacterized protein n=1 Tax=Leptospira idonii TaxID=1193500 RepID=A0A4R9LXP7_9LEPT|nr:hypothetical protein [Leptospira idonii]TGN18195.1 hypothetical protein EHS15_12335 [Leptospira idonii]